MKRGWVLPPAGGHPLAHEQLLFAVCVGFASQHPQNSIVVIIIVIEKMTSFIIEFLFFTRVFHK